MDDVPPLRALLTTILAGGLIVGVFLAVLVPTAGILLSAQKFKSTIKLSDLAQRSTVYDSQDHVIAVLGSTNREDVTLHVVPKILRNAVIAVEDKTFWHNDGVDLNAVVRAALKNATSGEIEQGGSTISQQLVKNRILSPKRDINRKVR